LFPYGFDDSKSPSVDSHCEPPGIVTPRHGRSVKPIKAVLRKVSPLGGINSFEDHRRLWDYWFSNGRPIAEPLVELSGRCLFVIAFGSKEDLLSVVLGRKASIAYPSFLF